MSSLYDITVRTPDGTDQALDAYRGKVVLIVNTASQCGFTPQYEGLEALWRQYREAGLVVLAFPCNQFGGQEPGSAETIANFCSSKYDVTFPVLAKVEVNGKGASPLFQWLKQEKSGLLGLEGIKWNFTKFLIGRNGQVLERFAPTTKPQAMTDSIQAALAQVA